jgi:hypothetical protein
MQEHALIQEMRILADKKMRLDFKCSLLSSPSLVASALKKSWKKLEVARLIDTNKAAFEELRVASVTWSGICSPESLNLLKSYGEIIVECPSFHSGAIAVLKSLRKRLGIDIKLNYESAYAQELFRKIEDSNKVCDFLVVADSPLLFSNIKAMEDYQFSLPCYFADQFVFKHKKSSDRKFKKILIISETSLEEHFRYLNFSSANRLSAEKEYIDSPDMSSRLNAFELDEMIIVWEPLASAFSRKASIEKIPEMTYQTLVSLYSHINWKKPSKRSLLKAFEEVFVSEWNYCNLQQDHTSSLLKKDHKYLIHLAISSGMERNKKKLSMMLNIYGRY